MDAGEVGAADGGAEGVQERLEMRGYHCFEEGEDGARPKGRIGCGCCRKVL